MASAVMFLQLLSAEVRQAAVGQGVLVSKYLLNQYVSRLLKLRQMN